MKKIWESFDWGIVGSVLLLLILGLTMIKSVAPSLFTHQLISALIGLVFFVFFALIDFRVYPQFKNHFYFLSCFFLFLTFVFGVVTRGSVRWLEIGEFTFQPSELVKPFLVLSLGSFLMVRPPLKLGSLLINLMILALPVFLVFAQPDLGSALIVVFFWLGMLLARGLPLKMIFFLIGLGLVLLPLGWWGLQTYQQARIFSFLNPYGDPLGAGYSLIQSMVAVGAGRFWGRGLGRGTQSHLRFLPERHTDFIFASLGEELGFLGALFLLLVFGFLFFRLLKITFASREKYGRVIGIGFLFWFFGQFFVNVGMNLGLVPITGLTLPLVSYGGSSLVAILIGLGIMTNLAFQSRQTSLRV